MQLDSEDLPDDYFCHHCLPDLHKHLLDGSSNPSTATLPASLPDASTHRFGQPPSRPIVHHGEASIPHATLPSRTASQVKPPTLVKIKLSASHRPSHPRSQRLTKEQARLVQADDSELDGDLEAIYEGLSRHGIPNGRHVSPSPSPLQMQETQSTDSRTKRRRVSTAEEEAMQTHKSRTKKARVQDSTPPPEQQQQQRVQLSPATTRHRVYNVPAQVWAKQARNDDLKRSTELLNSNDIPPYIIDNRDLNQPTERALKRMTASEFRRALEIGDIAYRDMLEFAQDTLRLFSLLDSLPSGVSRGWSQLDEGVRETAIARIAEEFEPTFTGKRYRQPAMWLLFTAYKQHLMAQQRAAKQAAAAAAAATTAEDSTQQDTEMIDAVPVTRGRPKLAARETPSVSAHASPVRSSTREADMGAAGRRSGRVKKASARAVAAAAADFSGGSASPDADRTRSVSRVCSESAVDTPMDGESTGSANASAVHATAKPGRVNEHTWPSAGTVQQPPPPRVPVPIMALDVEGPAIRHPWHGVTAQTPLRQQASSKVLKTPVEPFTKLPPPNTVPIASPFSEASTAKPLVGSNTGQSPMQPRPPRQVPFKATKFSPGAGLSDGSHLGVQNESEKQHARGKQEVGTTSTHAFYGSSR
ncbi:hypothetical protein BCR37DRAFT_105879 [Protomyces lactucae-debilis]|uniref:Uncharacterized protein n=1 Tax=Protomyces lactucae-debilis TaxID=2754530 RepID=A0A1Y2F4W4_PROLT|nr:uncharacterized protein BCR37DRAFT_105879 [Protomyces lactucae-debilis]ORY78524.1 hypothetical protein BCR37DRAFT_105879 [Protomyces lactucae-debilis]